MARSHSSSPSRQTRESSRLANLAIALTDSGSRIEDRYWEGLLEQSLIKLLRTSNDSVLEAALSYLSEENPSGYEILAEQAEFVSESIVVEHEGRHYDALLVVAPITAWTRYQIPTPAIAADHLQALSAQLHGHVLAADTKLALVPHLLSVEQMPRSFSEAWQWLQRLSHQALGVARARALPAPKTEDDTDGSMLADTRYLVGVVLAEQGMPLFRWQESPEDGGATRQECEAAWASQAQPTIAQLLPGCGFECLLPNSYYLNNREADRRVRPLALQAALAWLESTLNVPASQIRAVIGACGDGRIEEYRIGFTPRQSSEVIYGCIWPLYGVEETLSALSEQANAPNPADDIIARLKTLGVVDIRRLPGLLSLEFCEDCDTPYFPNPLGEMVHAELPDGAETDPGHFH